MSRLVLRNGWVYCRSKAGMAIRGVRAGMHWGIIVGIHHMASGASAVSVVARLVVRSGETEQGIEQSRFLQSQKDRISTKQCAESAVTEFYIWPARLFIRRRNAYFGLCMAAAFENPQHISGLRYLPSFQWFEGGQNPFQARFFRSRRGKRHQALRGAVRRVTLAKMRLL